MTQQTGIQDFYLNQLRKKHIPMTMFLTNGFQIRGLVKAFDNFTVLVESDGKQQLVFKHAISTFVPAENVEFNQNTD